MDANSIDVSENTEVDLEQAADALSLPAYTFAKRNKAVLTQDAAGELLVFATTETKPEAVAEIQRFAGCPITLKIIDSNQFEEQLKLAYDRNSEQTIAMVEDLGDSMDLASLADSVPETEDLLESEDDAPIIRLINALLTEAVKQNASDVHIETYEKRVVVRYRIDGILQTVVEPKRELAPLLISRIKVMSKLDIAEKRIPQDGRISLRVSNRDVDIRVSTLPSANSERVVLRLLDKQAGRLKLAKLGMQKKDESRLSTLLHKPHGIILVTGPTGSGKTTTLYAGLSHINNQEKNILTIEDPIEYQLDGIGQTQVNTKANLTFAQGLRAILRQDPDVVMVGEIRDKETVDIAIQASLTGHLVLSTLHTNTAIGAVTRLEDMGVEPFLLASSLAGILAQRLVRVLCPHCKAPHTADRTECELLGVDPNKPPVIYHAVGCDQCKQLGYIGRTGIYELISIDNKMKRMIHDRAAESDLIAAAREQSDSIRFDGAQRVLAGQTCIDEVLRVTQED